VTQRNYPQWQQNRKLAKEEKRGLTSFQVKGDRKLGFVPLRLSPTKSGDSSVSKVVDFRLKERITMELRAGTQTN
jgi:hypothetical protein